MDSGGAELRSEKEDRSGQEVLGSKSSLNGVDCRKSH